MPGGEDTIQQAIDRPFDSYLVGRTKVHTANPARALAVLRRSVAERVPSVFVFATASTIVAAETDAGLHGALEQATLVLPDGMPLVWLGRARDRSVRRVYGPDFLLYVLQEAPELRHFFYGGGQGTAETMAERLKALHPALQVAGTLMPPFGLEIGLTPEEHIDAINESGADVVWVGLGHPKQELWMQHERARLNAPVLAGVGAAFDFHSGEKQEAPRWMKASGLQWLHRLLSEPGRLWKRYLVGNSKFLLIVARQKLRGAHRITKDRS